MPIQMHTYLKKLPAEFYEKTQPLAVSQPEYVVFNSALAKKLQLENLDLESRPGCFSGNDALENTEPFAQAYAGHQFANFTMLGDGRAHVLGEITNGKGQSFDLHLKGSGATKFSRGGDGRATLGPMLREYIISEAMNELGVPTTRSLAVVKTGEIVLRQVPEPGAILARVASSHLRVGTFEYAAALGDKEKLKSLADYSIEKHYPEVLSSENPYREFFFKVMDVQAQLIAKWMGIGFIHGVMNTDNMTISGESIDYGPCAFMDEYNPATVFSSIDRQGRYAYANQPAIAQWNLSRLAETLLPLFSDKEKESIDFANKAVEKFGEKMSSEYFQLFSNKLGMDAFQDSDKEIFEDLFKTMHSEKMDFTRTFYLLSEDESSDELKPLELWKPLWKSRRSENWKALMESVNPQLVPRNHLVEEALAAAVEDENLQPLNDLVEAMKKPFQRTERDERFLFPKPGYTDTFKTFCGT